MKSRRTVCAIVLLGFLFLPISGQADWCYLKYFFCQVNCEAIFNENELLNCLDGCFCQYQCQCHGVQCGSAYKDCRIASIYE